MRERSHFFAQKSVPLISWAAGQAGSAVGIRTPVFICVLLTSAAAAPGQEFYSRKHKVPLDPGALESWVELFLLKKKKKEAKKKKKVRG